MLDECGCAGVMIGRGTLGNPWLIKECVEYLENGTIPKMVSVSEKMAMMRDNITKLVEEKEEHIAVLELRSQLMFYLKGLANTKETKLRICAATTKEELFKIINDYETSLVE